MEDKATMLFLQSREDRPASVKVKLNGSMNLDQSSALSKASSLWMNDTGSEIRYLKSK